LDPRDDAEALRASWQGRCLCSTDGLMGAVVLSVLAHNFDDAMPALLRACGRVVQIPFLCTAARIRHSGEVTADVVVAWNRIAVAVVLFDDEQELRDRFRDLADLLKLSDADHIELFACVRRWVVCDYRLDPHMNPADPDAKRLVH
jgi:hypothetical protein